MEYLCTTYKNIFITYACSTMKMFKFISLGDILKMDPFWYSNFINKYLNWKWCFTWIKIYLSQYLWLFWMQKVDSFLGYIWPKNRSLLDYYNTWSVPDFGGRNLDMAPNFFQYWHFCSTIINVGTYGNPHKMGITHQLIQIRCAQARFCRKYDVVE